MLCLSRLWNFPDFRENFTEKGVFLWHFSDFTVPFVAELSEIFTNQATPW